ncbi:MAG: beta-glucosidase BglX [Spirosomataceae bacterium]
MDKILIPFCLLVATVSMAQKPSKDQFINALLSKMTIEEKIGQLNLVTGGEATTGSVVSTGVEEKIKAGNIGGIFSISTPQRIRKVQELAVNQSRLKIPIIFGMDVIHGYRTAFPIPLALSCSWDMNLIERSARIAAIEATADGICWTYSPMVDICRDPRWGRIAEGAGEDVYLGSAIAKAMVKGYQGDGYAKNNTMMSCVKHYALYGASEAGRDYNTTDMSRVRMYNEYLPPYKAALDAGAGSIMASFNEIDGVPATANRWLLTDLLRKEWGFNGLVVTDYTGINEMIDHGLGDLQTVSAKALRAGIDMDMVGEGFLTTLKKSLQEKKVTEQEITEACRKVLEAKYDLGLFENPYRYCDENRAKTEIFTEANRKAAREAASKSCVLLKNSQNLLPLAKKGTIALVGPLVTNKENMAGTWAVSADFKQCVSLAEGIKNAVGSQVNLVTAKGANIYSDAKLEANVSIFGKPTNRDNRSDTELIDEALKASQNADVIVAALGEAAEMTGEASSRSDIKIPQNQQELLKALLKTGKPVVLVVFTGRPLDLSWEDSNVSTILNTWFGGTEAGNAIADVLFGDVNPSGKLSVTFPRNAGQIPIFYNHKNTGRPHSGREGFEKFRSNYLDVSNTPLYPFGYGLSYTKFTYSDVLLSNQAMSKGGKIEASVTVQNTGNYDGEEVVQLYIRDKVGSVTRPLKELKGFKKIALKKGESQKVSFSISEEDLKFYDNTLNYIAEAGEFEVMIGTNSQDVKRALFVLKY